MQKLLKVEGGLNEVGKSDYKKMLSGLKSFIFLATTIVDEPKCNLTQWCRPDIVVVKKANFG
jgi:hypothetical protein